jgi:5-methylcytosine-specific restriction protein A
MSVMSAALLERIAERDRLDAQLAADVAEFDAAELWDLDDATSMQAWLRDKARMSGGQAHRLVMAARRTRPLPVTCSAWASGELSGGQVEVILANVGKDTDVFAGHEADLVPHIAAMSILETVDYMQEWRRRVDALKDVPAEPEPTSKVFLSNTLDGRGALNGDLDADDNLVVATALRVATVRDLEGEPKRTAAEARADALAVVCQFFLDNQHSKPGGRHRPHVNVLMDLESWESRGVNGPVLNNETLERIMCDCAFHRVLTDGRSGILDVGTATRVLTAAMWVALVARDEHCRFPSCDRPATWCDGHHIHWFSRGGPTAIDNLVLLCRRHHKRLHQPGWHAKLLPDGTFEVTNPDGLVRSSHPPGALRFKPPPNHTAEAA